MQLVDQGLIISFQNRGVISCPDPKSHAGEMAHHGSAGTLPSALRAWGRKVGMGSVRLQPH